MMNHQSPLISQGSLSEQKNQGRTRVKIAVFVVLAIHGIGLMVLLMQGCQKPPETPPPPAEPTNAAPPFVEPTNALPAVTNTAVAPAPPPVVETPTPPVIPAGATEYVIVKGDTLEKIAKKSHLSVKALTTANPGIEPAKLKIGQKIHIPAGAAPVASAAVGAAPAEGASATGGQSYSVKSGDTLSSIAKEKGTTIKALRAANSLKTDRITVGQKLKIPAKAAAPATIPAAPTEPASGVSTSTPPASPAAR